MTIHFQMNGHSNYRTQCGKSRNYVRKTLHGFTQNMPRDEPLHLTRDLDQVSCQSCLKAVLGHSRKRLRIHQKRIDIIRRKIRFGTYAWQRKELEKEI